MRKINSIEECIHFVMDRAKHCCENTRKAPDGMYTKIVKCPEKAGKVAVTYKGRVTLTPKKVNNKSDTEPKNYLVMCYGCLRDYELSKLKITAPRSKKKDKAQLDLF